jgi:hypothetical protein
LLPIAWLLRITLRIALLRISGLLGVALLGITGLLGISLRGRCAWLLGVALLGIALLRVALLGISGLLRISLRRGAGLTWRGLRGLRGLSRGGLLGVLSLSRLLGVLTRGWLLRISWLTVALLRISAWGRGLPCLTWLPGWLR